MYCMYMWPHVHVQKKQKKTIILRTHMYDVHVCILHMYKISICNMYILHVACSSRGTWYTCT